MANNEITFIYSKVLKNSNKSFQDKTIIPQQDTTGGGLWIISKDIEFCQDPVNHVIGPINSCYFNGLNFDLIP